MPNNIIWLVTPAVYSIIGTGAMYLQDQSMTIAGTIAGLIAGFMVAGFAIAGEKGN